MKIERKRWVIMRKDRKEIMCGLSRNYEFKPVDKIAGAAIKTYRSKAQAVAAVTNTNGERWLQLQKLEVVPVLESIEVLEE